MNVEHRKFNIEHRIMYSVYFKKTERSESIIRHSSFDIRHSNVSQEMSVSNTENRIPIFPDT
ncbi:hypothetical protein D1AOALGA4SA_1466 [Olavius algarvensis Delta 1 endosymbiont]|nr:hypothetical protein D1AOALGA4SA_1466 [Olavius algarvensis Delta 1 endosymbiont]